MNNYCDELRSLLAKGGGGPILVHADVFRARAAIMPITDPASMLPQHIQALEFIADSRPLLFPAFNYDFLRTGLYRPGEDASQVGPLTEYARQTWADYRLGGPVFNVVGRATKPTDVEEAGTVDPFGGSSVFSYMHRTDGDILLYGTTIASMTAIHYIERLAGGPAYRYDKIFPGYIRDKGGERAVSLVYHCRPLGRSLDYDFHRLAAEAEDASVLTRSQGHGSEIAFVRFSALCEFWLDKLRADPLYLLDLPSRAWVAAALDRLGRRFDLADFE